MTFELSEAQRETLECVRERPDAPQSDIATELDVTRATVSRRLSAIPGFEWDDRKEFIATHFDDEKAPDLDADSSPPGDADGTDGDTDRTASDADETSLATDEAESGADGTTADTEADDAGAAVAVDHDRVAELERRVETLEETSDAADADGDADDADIPRDLAHRTLHAAMESDRISEEEELELMAHLLDE